MPVFPGQMRYVRKNLYHAVYVIDPATPKGLQASLFLIHFDQVVILWVNEVSVPLEKKNKKRVQIS